MYVRSNHRSKFGSQFGRKKVTGWDFTTSLLGPAEDILRAARGLPPRPIEEEEEEEEAADRKKDRDDSTGKSSMLPIIIGVGAVVVAVFLFKGKKKA